MTDFTEENGATRVIPGSHRFDDRLRVRRRRHRARRDAAGLGALLHRLRSTTAAARTAPTRTRYGVNITYACRWLRQEENQYLAVPPEVARTLPDALLRLMGYARGAYALGYVDDLRDPLEVLRPDLGSTGLGDLDAALARVREH